MRVVELQGASPLHWLLFRGEPPVRGGEGGSGVGAVEEGSAPGGDTAPRVGEDELGRFWELLDPETQPLMPAPECPESQQIFDEHKEMARKYLVLQQEIYNLYQQKKDLAEQVIKEESKQQLRQTRYQDKIMQLQNKGDALLSNHTRLRAQLDRIRSNEATGSVSTPPTSSGASHYHHQPQPHHYTTPVPPNISPQPPPNHNVPPSTLQLASPTGYTEYTTPSPRGNVPPPSYSTSATSPTNQQQQQPYIHHELPSPIVIHPSYQYQNASSSNVNNLIMNNPPSNPQQYTKPHHSSRSPHSHYNQSPLPPSQHPTPPHPSPRQYHRPAPSPPTPLSSPGDAVYPQQHHQPPPSSSYPYPHPPQQRQQHNQHYHQRL